MVTAALDHERVGIVSADCLELLASLLENSIDSVVTDPPYELGFMGKTWDASGIAYSVELWREVLRVLKPGGHLLAFGGTRTYHRMTVAIEDAGFEIRDSLHWIYGTGFPKSLNLGDGRGTALKPGHEPIVMARKPLVGTVAANVERYGTGALNIDGCRLPTSEVWRARHNNNSLGSSTGGIYGDAGACVTEKHPAGRWPANVLLDEGAAAELDEQSGIAPTAKPRDSRPRTDGARGTVDFKSGSVPTTPNDRGDGGGASRFFYVAKPSRKERDAGCEALPPKTAGEATDRGEDTAGLENPRAGAGRTGGARNFHPTVKPVELMRHLVRLVTPPGGTVLDPFLGSGTTGVAALLEGFNFLGIEKSEEYLPIAIARIEHALKGAA